MRAVVALRIFDGEYSDIVPPPDRITPALRQALRTGNTLSPRPMQESLDLVARSDRQVRFAPPAASACFPAAIQSGALLRRVSDCLPGRWPQASIPGCIVTCWRPARRAETRDARLWPQQVVEHMEAIGAFSGRWSCAHSNWVTEAEIAIMAKHGAGSAVLNPEIQSQDRVRYPPDPRVARRQACRARSETDGREHQRQSDPAGCDAARRDPASRGANPTGGAG